MILNEHNSEQPRETPTGDCGTLEPGPVWYTPNPQSAHANGGPVPAVLVRLCDARAWIALLQPGGRWKRFQVGFPRLAPRLEVRDLDRAWAADLDPTASEAPDAPGGAEQRPASRLHPPSTARGATQSAAAAPSPAPPPGWVRARDAAADLQCPDCGATGGRTGRKFGNLRDLRLHRKWCLLSPHPAVADPAPATAPASGPFHCPHCGTTHSAYGRQFRDARHLRRHSSRCAYAAPAPQPRRPATAGQGKKHSPLHAPCSEPERDHRAVHADAG